MDTTTDTFQEILKLLYVFSFSLGLWTCLNIVVNKLGPGGARASLMTFIAVLLLIPVNGYLGLVVEEQIDILDSLASTLTWCYGPLMLMLVNSLIRADKHPKISILHFLPFIAVASLHFTHLGWIGFEFYLPALVVQVGVYLTLSLSILYRHRLTVLTIGKEFKNSAYYWMLYLIAGLFVILLYDTVLMFALHYGAQLNYYFVSTTACAFSVYISTISLFLLLQPNFFEKEFVDTDSLESVDTLELSNTKAQGDEKDEAETENKLRYVELSPSLANDLGEKLSNLMTEHKPHLESDVSLGKLASLLGVTSHQLSELLNIHMETNFYDYLNSLRYKEAVHLMATYPNNYSITDIAFLSGFNNRNSFYKVFKKYEGVTPGEYRKQCALSG